MIPAALSTSHIGARYIAVLVEIGDDEKPITQAEKENDRIRPAAQPQPAPKSAGATRDWKDIQPAQQAGIRSNDPVFIAFLKEIYPYDWRESQDGAACIRLICKVHSRSELGTDQRKRVLWHHLDQEFQLWQAMERAS
jgi:hypothetical protein